MPEVDDWQNMVVELRDNINAFLEQNLQLIDFFDFYESNQSDAYFGALTGTDEVADTGLTKQQVIYLRDAINDIQTFLNDGAVATSDRMQLFQSTRSTG